MTLVWRVLRAAGLAAVVLVLGSLGAVVLAVLFLGVPHFSRAFFTQAPGPGFQSGGIYPALMGTLVLVLPTTLLALPLGMATGIYLSELAGPGSLARRVIGWSVARMAGLPSIVYGLFGLGFFVLTVGRRVDELFFGGSLTYGQPAVLWSGLTLGAFILPVVVVATQESLAQVPQGLRHAARALGLGPWTITWRVVLPLAARGILAGSLLAVGRSVGEVAPYLFTGAAYFAPIPPRGPADQFMDLGYHVFVLATQSPDVEATKPMLFGTMAVLLLVTLGLHGVYLAIRAKEPAGRRRP